MSRRRVTDDDVRGLLLGKLRAAGVTDVQVTLGEPLELTAPDPDDGTPEPADTATERAREGLRRAAEQPFSEELRRQTQARVRAMRSNLAKQGELL